MKLRRTPTVKGQPGIHARRTAMVAQIRKAGKMKRIIFATIPLVMFAGIGTAHLGIPQAMAEPAMSQEQFPCQEDEVLGYAPEFGHEHVGCIHIDQLRGE